MTTPTTIGLNTNLTNSTNFTINFPQTASELITQMATTANQQTDHMLMPIVLYGATIISYLSLSDRTQFSEMKYTDIRAISISFGVMAVMAITLFQTGLYSNLTTVIQFVTIFTIFVIALLLVENRE